MLHHFAPIRREIPGAGGNALIDQRPGHRELRGDLVAAEGKAFDGPRHAGGRKSIRSDIDSGAAYLHARGLLVIETGRKVALRLGIVDSKVEGMRCEPALVLVHGIAILQPGTAAGGATRDDSSG